MRSHSSMELVDAERAALPRSHTSLGFADAAPEMAQEDEMVAIVTLARRCVQMERRCHGKVRSRWIQSIAKEGRVPQSYSTHEAGRALRCRISHLEAEICRANKLARFQQMKQERSVSPIGRLAALTRPTSAGCDSRPQHPPTSWASANLACNATARARNIIMSRTHSWPAQAAWAGLPDGNCAAALSFSRSTSGWIPPSWPRALRAPTSGLGR